VGTGLCRGSRRRGVAGLLFGFGLGLLAILFGLMYFAIFSLLSCSSSISGSVIFSTLLSLLHTTSLSAGRIADTSSSFLDDCIIAGTRNPDSRDTCFPASASYEGQAICYQCQALCRGFVG
jgi:hypothetical protein